MRSHLKVYFSFEDDTQALTDSERGNLLLAMLRYAKDGREPELTGNERFLFPVLRGQIDRDIDAYDTLVSNGSRGGRPKTNRNQDKPNETKDNQEKPNETKENQDEPNLTKTPKIEDRRYKIEDRRYTIEESEFTPPTIEEVRCYCIARGNRIDAERFVNYYQARGWEIRSGQQMKDWRACVRSWEGREKSSSAQVSAQMYGQRDYKGEDSLSDVQDVLRGEMKA